MDIKFTKAEKAYLDKYGRDVCIAAYQEHMAGSGGNTVGEMFLYGIVEPRYYTKGGDVLINTGEKLIQQSKTS